MKQLRRGKKRRARKPHKTEGLAVGELHSRLLGAFDQAGGDIEACPFQTIDDPYMGPSLGWAGGVPRIVPSEFPEEFQ